VGKEIDWTNLGFGYVEAEYRWVALFKDGKWQKGELSKDSNVSLNECACVLQYAQTAFEGMKAYRQENGDVVLFRPDLNATRLQESCRRLLMPEIANEDFMDAVREVVEANIDLVPPYGSGATLYIRPYVMGVSPIMGLKPATEFMFRIIVSPVGKYFSKPEGLRLVISEFDRAAPRGTGHVKAGLNYAMSLFASAEVAAKGFDECLFLDSKTRSYIEETKGANVLFVKGDTLVTPKSDTILPSITRRSLMTIAEKYLGLKCEERQISIDEIGEFSECGLCGTAAIISPVGSITHDGKEIKFAGMGEVLTKVYEKYIDIQLGKVEAPEGWIYKL
jgi:branched-chain amino acid aminotransferase